MAPIPEKTASTTTKLAAELVNSSRSVSTAANPIDPPKSAEINQPVPIANSDHAAAQSFLTKPGSLALSIHSRPDAVAKNLPIKTLDKPAPVQNSGSESTRNYPSVNPEPEIPRKGLNKEPRSRIPGIEKFGSVDKGPKAKLSFDTSDNPAKSADRTTTINLAPNTAGPAATAPPAPITVSTFAASPQISNASFGTKVWDTDTSNFADTAPVQSGADTRPQVSQNTLDPRIVRTIPSQLIEAIRQSPERPVEIALHPEELGRVQMMMVTAEGSIQIVFTAERSETLELMRRNIEQLSEEFRNLGYDNINFSFGQDGDGPMREEREKRFLMSIEDNAEPHGANDLSAYVGLSGVGIDIRI